MAIIKREDHRTKREIDLRGPEGNAYVLLSRAKDWSKQLELDWDIVKAEMTSGDYENLIKVFDKYFGNICDLIR